MTRKRPNSRWNGRADAARHFPFSATVLACLLGLLPDFALGQTYRLDPTAAEQAYRGVEIVQVREDTFDGPPDGPRPPNHLSNKVDELGKYVSQGIYRSPYLGFEIRVPRLSNSNRTHVHQALVSRRPDGSPITSHVLFLPDGAPGAAALVVTRLRDDRPKDPESILSRFEPRTSDEVAALAQRGVKSIRLNGPLGPAVQRSIRNRALSWHFPYRVNIDSSPALRSYGVSRWVVQDGFLLEFSVVTAETSGGGDLDAKSSEQLDLFIAGLLKNPR
jgi:hypothetical protein